MEIKKALEATGKASKGDNEAHVELINSINGVKELMWVCEGVDEAELGYVQYGDIITDDWRPYHDKKEIRPEIGDIWEIEDGSSGFIHGSFQYADERDFEDMYITFTTGFKNSIKIPMVHGENGWKRIHPPVEDDSIERVVIENCAFLKHEGKNITVVFPTSTGGQFNNGSFEKYTGKKPMEMILKIPKEEK